MRSLTTRLSLLASLATTFAALSAGAAPLAAQTMASTDVRPVALAAAPTAALRPVAVYRFAPTRLAGIPTEVTLADSAGQLVARYRLADDATERPMLAVLIGDGIVLQAETPRGVLTLQLHEIESADPSRFYGSWSLESQSGTLRARVK